MPAERPQHGPAMPPDDDDENRGRAALVERLFREHNEALVRFLLVRLRSSHAAREVAQEAYVRLLRLDRPIGTASHLQSLLFRTAANLATDRQRRERKYVSSADWPLFFDNLPDVRTPERQASSAQTAQRLERLIAALPPKCREAFLLNRVDGLDFASIAQRMSLSERMVRAYVSRALLHCRTRVDEFEESRDD
ncbi:RNA polymerase sigma factor [Steroidobacter sp.]|uniref:RNA polymerase sigma factor n=1 Tax=Steroidobacter sp. TaxID=1978227 RepID=UPI001A38FB8F|nr:RNA polymerase sigma factor [Steroidobacter sp.]MBL8268797.1 RNA polymerase sigma factor [Steroidobacter sp.]